MLLETYPAVPYLIVVGGGELAELLAVQARVLGWQAEITEDGDQVRRLLTLRSATACLVVLSHDPGLDVPALRTALTQGTPYVGALGSRRTQARRSADLLKEGLTDAQVRLIHGPIGLDLGARTPAETALAICAEVLGALAGRQVRSLRDRPGPVNA